MQLGEKILNLEEKKRFTQLTNHFIVHRKTFTNNELNIKLLRS